MAALSRGCKAKNSVKMHSLTILKFHCNSPLYFSFAFCASAISTARFVAASTASISALLNPDLSSTCIPAIVVPPGEQTSSFNCNTENKNTGKKELYLLTAITRTKHRKEGRRETANKEKKTEQKSESREKKNATYKFFQKQIYEFLECLSSTSVYWKISILPTQDVSKQV